MASGEEHPFQTSKIDGRKGCVAAIATNEPAKTTSSKTTSMSPSKWQVKHALLLQVLEWRWKWSIALNKNAEKKEKILSPPAIVRKRERDRHWWVGFEAESYACQPCSSMGAIQQYTVGQLRPSRTDSAVCENRMCTNECSFSLHLLSSTKSFPLTSDWNSNWMHKISCRKLTVAVCNRFGCNLLSCSIR